MIEIEVDHGPDGPAPGAASWRRVPSLLTGSRLARHGSIGASASALVGVLIVALSPGGVQLETTEVTASTLADHGRHRRAAHPGSGDPGSGHPGPHHDRQADHHPAAVPRPPSNGSCWNLVMQDDFNGSSVDTSTWAPYNSGGNAGHGLRRPSPWATGSSRPRPAWRTARWCRAGCRHEFYTFIHKPFGSTSDQDYTVHSANASDWHTRVLEWRPGQMNSYRDGSLIKQLDETSADLIPDVAHFATIQLDAWHDSLPDPVSMQVDYIKVYSAC